MPARGPETLPFFIKAQSADGLRREMRKENYRRGTAIDYFDIQHVNGQWYAWYYKRETIPHRGVENDISSK